MQGTSWIPPDFSISGGLDGTGPLSPDGHVSDLDSDDDRGATSSGQETASSEGVSSVPNMSLLSSFMATCLPTGTKLISSAYSFLPTRRSISYYSYPDDPSLLTNPEDKFRYILSHRGPLDKLDRAIDSLAPSSRLAPTSLNEGSTLIVPSSVTPSAVMGPEVYLAKQIATRLFNSTATLQDITGTSQDPAADIEMFNDMSELLTPGPGVDTDDIIRYQWTNLITKVGSLTRKRGQTIPNMTVESNTDWRVAVDGLTAHVASLSRDGSGWTDGDSAGTSTGWSVAAASVLALAGYGLYSLYTGDEGDDE